MKCLSLLKLAILGLSLSACNQNSADLTSNTKSPASAPQDTLAAGTATVQNCQTNTPLLLPTKATNTEASLTAYLQELQQAVQTQNAAQLQQLLDPNIKTDFGGNGGWSDFKSKWQPENKNSEVWLLLDHLLRLGGGYPLEGNKSLYALPYVYSQWPDSVDAFSHVAVVKDGAVLRDQPSANAQSVCTLDRIILQTDYEASYPQGKSAEQIEWWSVQTIDGNLKGYINQADVYSPVAYRALFNKNKQGKWQMTALVAGD